MKYASTKAIEKLWGIFKTALSNKVDTTDARLSDNRTPKSHASANTSYGVSSGNVYGHAKASSTVPKMDGTASAGEEVSSFARGDHTHPTDTTRASAETVGQLSKELQSLSDDLQNTVKQIALDVLVSQNDLNIPLSDSEGNELCSSDGNGLTGHFELVFR